MVRSLSVFESSCALHVNPSTDMPILQFSERRLVARFASALSLSPSLSVCLSLSLCLSVSLSPSVSGVVDYVFQ